MCKTKCVKNREAAAEAIGIQTPETYAPDFVDANLNFPRRNADGKPPRNNLTGIDDPSLHTQRVETVQTRIYNARQDPSPPSLHQQGFQLVNHATDVNFDNQDEINGTYYAEMEALVCRMTGAQRAFSFHHASRRPESTEMKDRHVSGFMGSVSKVHGDFSATSGRKQLELLGTAVPSGSAIMYHLTEPQLTPEELSDVLENRRYMIINVWRNTSREAPVMRCPLACLDCTTVDEEKELFVTEMLLPDRINTDLSATDSFCIDEQAHHRWCYFPKMSFEEAVMFKTFDSSTDPDEAHYVIHSAFEDPTTKPEDPSRQSIEVRVLAIMPK